MPMSNTSARFVDRRPNHGVISSFPSVQHGGSRRTRQRHRRRSAVLSMKRAQHTPPRVAAIARDLHERWYEPASAPAAPSKAPQRKRSIPRTASPYTTASARDVLWSSAPAAKIVCNAGKPRRPTSVGRPRATMVYTSEIG
jgi:hypothetical protein